MCFSGEFLALRCNKITLQNAVDLIKAHIQGRILILQHTFTAHVTSLQRWGRGRLVQLLRSKGKLSNWPDAEDQTGATTPHHTPLLGKRHPWEQPSSIPGTFWAGQQLMAAAESCWSLAGAALAGGHPKVSAPGEKRCALRMSSTLMVWMAAVTRIGLSEVYENPSRGFLGMSTKLIFRFIISILYVP
jgi:hypothetical protein